MDLSQITRAQLEEMTKAAIIEMALEGVTREEITERKFDKVTGELTFIKTEITDAYTSATIEVNEVDKKYYSSGEIDEIEVKKTDDKGKVKERYKIKHSQDGKKPVKEKIVELKENTIIEPKLELEKIIVSQDTEFEIPTVNEVPKLFGIPVMSKTLWKALRKQ